MRVLVLGGTGSIGAPVVTEIIRRGHEVVALARSTASAIRVAELGATPISGDIGTPEEWLGRLPSLDAIIHAACDFDQPMELIERRLLDGLLPYFATQRTKPRFVYTGGCWLFGATGKVPATEETPFNPLPAFAWMVPHVLRVLDAPGIEPVIIHPAMVYEANGGVFRQFADDALNGSAIRIVGNEDIHWPLVHREDLADLYSLVLEGKVTRTSYIGVAVDTFPVGRIARAFGQLPRSRTSDLELVSPDHIAAELGEWARGYALDQQMSGEKARCELNWTPKHLDPLNDVASISRMS